VSAVHGAVSPEFRERPNILALSVQQYYLVLGQRLSKHKTTGYARNLGETIAPLTPPGYAYVRETVRSAEASAGSQAHLKAKYYCQVITTTFIKSD